MLFYVVLGAVMDELSMILLTIPIFFPMIMGLDFGMPKESVAIWFGIMVLMTVGFGLLAPPVGLTSTSSTAWPRTCRSPRATAA